MERRGGVIGIALGLLLAHGPAWAGLVVKTHSPAVTRNYWIVRDMDRDRIMRQRPGATLQQVVQLFRRFPINGLALPTKANVGYTVYPECRGQMKPDGVPADGGQASVWIDC